MDLKLRCMHLIVLCFCLINYSIGQTAEGPLSGGTFTNSARAGSSTSWTNTSNAVSSDDTYVDIPANGLSSNGAYTDNLIASNFGFSIPPGSTINGIEVEIERTDINNAKDDFIAIVKGGTVGLEDKSLNPAWSGEAYFTYGSSSDLWSETWSVADINASNFGVSISIRKQGGGANPAPLIDHVRITVHYTEVSLPIQLVTFSTEVVANTVMINWTTAAEINNDFFTVEKSDNGSEWNVLSTLNGGGNSNVKRSYFVVDYSPYDNYSYYRLKQTDYDGTFKYFEPNVVYLEKSSRDLVGFPNPTFGTISFDNQKPTDRFVLLNSKGQILQKNINYTLISTEAGRVSIDLLNLPAGIYLLKNGIDQAKIIKM